MKFYKLNPRFNNAEIDDNRTRGIIVLNTVGSTPLAVSGISLSGVGAMTVAIVDGSGSQITSFGGGTQYTDAGTPPAHPVGNTLEWNNGGTWATVGSSAPLPVSITAGSAVIGHVITDANSVTAATLSAETTKAIGVVRNSDGAGNLLTSNSTTFTAKFGLDVNVLGVLGTAFTTAGKIDIKGADGDVFVRQATASNLNATVVGTGTFAVQATLAAETTKVIGTVNIASSQTIAVTQATASSLNATVVGTGTFVVQATLATETTKVIGTVRLLGNAGAIVDAATAAAVPANGIYEGNRGTTALPTAVADAQLVGAMADKFGRRVSLISTIRDLVGTQTTTISASTSETTIVTAGAAGILNDIIMIIVSNTSASTNTRIDFRDATAGTILFSLQSVGGANPIGFALPTPIPQTTAANNWTAQCSASTTDVRIYVVYAKNK